MNVGSTNATVTFSNSSGGTGGYTYSYDFNDSGIFEITGSSSPTVTIPESYVDNAPSTLVVHGRITDSAGDYTDYTTSITISNVVNATFSGPSSVNAGSTNATVTFSNPTGGSGGYTYSYDFNDSGTFEIINSSSPTATIPESYVDNGPATLVVHGRITDSAGDYSDYTTSITIKDVAPTATLSNNGPVYVSSPVTVSFSNPSDPSNADTTAGFHYSFALDPADLATSYTTAGTSTSAIFTFKQSGTDTVYGAIYDQNNGFTDYTTTVTVNPLPPAIIIDDSSRHGLYRERAFLGRKHGWSGVERRRGLQPRGGHWGCKRNLADQPGSAGSRISGAGLLGRLPIRLTARPQYSIYDGNTLVATVTMDQQVAASGPTYNGVTFETLASIVPTTGTITVSVTNEGWGAVVADAVRIAPPGETPPSAKFTGPTPVTAGSTNATVSFADQQGGTAPYTYSYDFGDTGTFEISNSSNPTATIPESYVNKPGTLVVRGRILDSVGDYTDYTTTITVNSGGGGGSPSFIIIDDSSPTGYSETGPSWSGNADGAAWNGEEDYNAEAAVGAATATWTTNQVQPGTQYLVQASWDASSDHCSAAQYNIYDGTTLIATVTVNQQVAPVGPTYNGVTFQTLTSLVPTTGTITVSVTNEAWGALIADAIRIAPPGETPPSAKFTGPTSVTAGTSNATVSFSDQQGGTAPYTYSYDFGDTGTFEINNSSSPTATIPESYLATPNTTLVVRGRIMDSLGDYTDYTYKIIVGAPGWIVTPYLNIPDFGGTPTIVSVQSGNWSNPATWSLDRVPEAGDIVDINPGTTVTYDVNDSSDSAPLNTVEVENGATLTFSTTTRTQLNVVNLVVLQGGTLDIGTQANPIPANLTATVMWVDQAINTSTDPEQYGNGLIALGTVNTYGAVKVPYVTLAQNANAGDTVLYLASPATGWQVGDQVPVARHATTECLRRRQWEHLYPRV